jgi:hypothetical protein
MIRYDERGLYLNDLRFSSAGSNDRRKASTGVSTYLRSVMA